MTRPGRRGGANRRRTQRMQTSKVGTAVAVCLRPGPAVRAMNILVTNHGQPRRRGMQKEQLRKPP